MMLYSLEMVRLTLHRADAAVACTFSPGHWTERARWDVPKKIQERALERRSGSENQNLFSLS